MAEHIEVQGLTTDKIKFVPVKKEDAIKLERLWYEYQGYQLLVTQFASDSPLKPDESRFRLILDHFTESFMEYNLLYNNLLREYIGFDFPDRIKTTFSFELIGIIIYL